jgi:hypothetical protein
MKRNTLNRWIASAALVAAGVTVGIALESSSTAIGQQTPPPVAFQSGGQLSLPILKEISATLHQMDARLARLETAALKASGGNVKTSRTR